jgi:hypothetical protein
VPGTHRRRDWKQDGCALTAVDADGRAAIDGGRSVTAMVERHAAQRDVRLILTQYDPAAELVVRHP